MWKALIAGTTILTIAGSTLAFAQQPSPTRQQSPAVSCVGSAIGGWKEGYPATENDC
jgi:hypothetical protein